MLASKIFETVFACKWTWRILVLLGQGFTRPSEILKNCPALSSKILFAPLKKLQDPGLCYRVVEPKKLPMEVRYRLNNSGKKLYRLVMRVLDLEKTLSLRP